MREMILRRLSDAFRRQDWFTVLVETLIVVLGVFIGLQVNNWNEARGLEAGVEEALLRVRDEASLNIDVIGDLVAKIDADLDGHAEAQAAIDTCDPSPEARVLVAGLLGRMTDDFSPTFVSVSMDELARRNEYLNRLSPSFRSAFDQYQSRVREEEEQLKINFRTMWDYHVVFHPSVDVNLAQDDTLPEGALIHDMEDICGDRTFRNRFFGTLGFIQTIKTRVLDLRGNIGDFQQALNDELEHRQ
jgi:hypothetical protein